MHDPHTVAFEIKYPIKHRTKHFPGGYRNSFITIWHKDPERKGDDDSCGWFKRASHGDPEVLEKIRKRFAHDWDSTFKSDSTGHTYYTGYFFPESGLPHLSVISVTLNLFWLASIEYFKSDWDKANRFMRRNLWDLIHFAENPHDSLFDSITRKFETGCNEKYDQQSRDARISSMASVIYGFILRKQLRWYQHPRWHVHHWRLQIHPLQDLWNWLFKRCAKCGKRFKWKESRIGNWEGTQSWHESCDGTGGPCENKEASEKCSA